MGRQSACFPKLSVRNFCPYIVMCFFLNFQLRLNALFNINNFDEFTLLTINIGTTDVKFPSGTPKFKNWRNFVIHCVYKLLFIFLMKNYFKIIYFIFIVFYFLYLLFVFLIEKLFKTAHRNIQKEL